MQETTALDEPAVPGGGLIERATLEVTAHDQGAAAVLKDHLPRGARVHVTYLANSAPGETVAQATALAKAGFEPIPHVAARSLESEAELNSYLARLVEKTGAKRVLLIAGDLPRQRGPFAASLDVLKTGALQRSGLTGVGFASHPEGHPVAPAPVMDEAMRAKLAYAAANGLAAELVTQFCFEAAPIIDHITHLRAIGVTAPVRIGLAAPTNPALLMKFAVRCGVGASVGALARQTARFGKLLRAAGPEDVIADLMKAFPGDDASDIAGLHFFVFSGVKKAATWLDALRAESAGNTGP
jgi:methylenetetrahydrofolate reductase (NADPH)